MDMINITDWKKDEHNAVFPVGARDKEMVWSPKEQVLNIKPDWPYLFKESIDRYPDQYWTELIAYIVSKYLDVDVPRVWPSIKHTDEGIICGSLIEWFYDVNTEHFVHAGQYFKALIPTFDEKTGKEHNFTDMMSLLRLFNMKFNLQTNKNLWMADMVLFDALIGNTDRHQENWGMVFRPDKTLILSPLFDNGTSLGHERFIENIKDWDKQRLLTYIRKGKHHLRLNREDTKNRLGLLTFVSLLSQSSEDIKNHMQQKVDKLDLTGMLSEIQDLTRVETEVSFSQDRFEWVRRNLELRFQLIKEELEK